MKNRIDIHSHILFGVDDGAKNIDESIELLRSLENIGFTDVFLTPHYINGSDYDSVKDINLKAFTELKKEIKNNELSINVYLGNEIFINDNIDSLVKDGIISSLNDSKYLLIELPFQNKINNLENILYEIKCLGYEVILAHVERYEYFQKNPKLLDELKEIGVLFQANYASILGYYGSKEKKLIKNLLKMNYIDFFGTDIHSINKTYVIDNFSQIEKKIIKIIGEEGYQNILNNSKDIIKTR